LPAKSELRFAMNAVLDHALAIAEASKLGEVAGMLKW
jgi:hypothetical protein